jgi:membrane fusion protein, multidrug efflux system
MKFLKINNLIGIGIVSILAACGGAQKAPQAPPPTQVKVETVSHTPVSYFDEYPGTVVALNEVELRPQISGFIKEVHFKDGQRVKKGQLLYTIDDQFYAANYQQALSNLNAQKVNMLRAQKDADRYHELDKKEAIAKQLVDNADAALAVLKDQVAVATANMAAVETNLRYTRINAPFDGVIGISSVKPGTSVSAGQTILNSISSDNELAVDFNVDQKEIYRFNMLLAAQQKSDSTFSIAFGDKLYPYAGRVALLDRAVNPQTGTIKVRLVFPNDSNLLIAGMNGTVRVRNNSGNTSVLIPYKAVVEQLGEYFVYVPNDSNVVSQRKVTLGKQIGSDILVSEGLADGERIVVEGVQNLREGAPVRMN